MPLAFQRRVFHDYSANDHARARRPRIGAVPDATSRPIEQGRRLISRGAARCSARAVPLVTALLIGLAGGGCAAGHSSQRYIAKRTSGPVEIAVDPKKSHRLPDPRVLEAARVEALKNRAATQPKPLPTIETTDRRLRDAIAVLQAAATPGSHVVVAQQYYRLKVFDESLKHFDSALDKAPELVAGLDGRARVWRDLGMLAYALADAQRAKFYAPRNPAVRNTLGTIHQALGQFDFARAEFREALRLDPSAAYARANLEQLERTHGSDKLPE